MCMCIVYTVYVLLYTQKDLFCHLSSPSFSSTSFSLPPSLLPSLQYLRDTLTPFVHRLMDEFSEDDCEVDPMKMPASASLPQNQANLTALVTSAWGDILKSFTKFPTYVTWTCTCACTCINYKMYMYMYLPLFITHPMYMYSCMYMINTHTLEKDKGKIYKSNPKVTTFQRKIAASVMYMNCALHVYMCT